MIYKTIITDATVKTINDAHKVVMRTMLTPDEKKPCPPFMVVGDGMLIVQSDYRPASKNAIVAECEAPDGDRVRLRVKFAAVRLEKSDKLDKLGFPRRVEKACLKDNLIDVEYLRGFVVRTFAKYGLTPVDGKVFVKYAGKAGEPEHGIKNCPVCEADAVWNVSDKDLLEKLLVTKVGRRGFLGLGMVRVVNQ